MIDAGALGLANISGSVVAWGHVNDDRFLDAFVLSADRHEVRVYEWAHASFAFEPSDALFTVPHDYHIVNVVPTDMNYDGHVDVLVMAEPVRASPSAAPLALFLWNSVANGSYADPLVLPAATRAQPLTLDTTGDLHMDLLGHAASDPSALTIWRNTLQPGHGGGFVLSAPQLFYTEQVPACELASPHSSALIDLNGDCLADLFLVCTTPDPAQNSYQIWTARKDGPMQYDIARTGLLPRHAGPLSFADMNRDGTIDVVVPVCTNGVCAVYIAYNEQMPLCAPETQWSAPVAPRCRDTMALCTADDTFSLNFSVDAMARLDVKALTGDAQLLLADDLAPVHTPVPIRIGDENKDGYPDLLLLTVPRGARPGQTRTHLLKSTACDKRGKAAGCTAHTRPEHRTFVRLPGTLDTFSYVRSASFVDLDEDGSLDIMLQSLKPTQLRTELARDVHFVQNNVFHDAFFLKTLTLNAACRGRCEPENATAFDAWGAGLGGASYKFAVLDPNGVRRAQQGGQQPQTAYQALQPPSAFFGLGRTNNYIESLFVGSTRRQPEPFLVMEGVIPNSEVVVTPWQEGTSPATWRRELYLHPGDWIHLVAAALLGLLAFLGAIVFALDLNEKREDERERLRAVHAINFDAL